MSAKPPQINMLLQAIRDHRKLSDLEKNILEKAYIFAQKAHFGQKRQTGEPYFTHCFETALTLAEWSLDTTTITAGLLHDVAEDTDTPLSKIKELFGEEVEFLVNGVTKLGKLKYREPKTESDRTAYMAENIRKMILAISEDLRVVFIKLADRLHNMRTLSALSSAKQKRIALETNDIYAPLAYRLGMQNLSGELEDLAFPFLHPQEHKWLLENLKNRYEENLQYLEKVKLVLEESLHAHNLHPLKIDYRAKRISSLYKKIARHDMSVDQIYDLIAFRIILSSVEDCYAVLGTIHQLWPPLPGKIKDYIALPKPNGYRSLHTTVFCLDKRITEFQIRTMQMHEEAENGIAASWAYNQFKKSDAVIQGKKPTLSFADVKELRWVQQLKNWQKDFIDPQEFLKSLKVDFFKDRVFAITPRGEVFDLPAGSTPVDFAYHIHTEIGDQCISARVNGKIVPLEYQIQSGDVVEILIQKSKKPSESWLQFLKTSSAKRRVKSAMKKGSSSSILSKSRPQFEIRIQAKDRTGFLKEVSDVISRSHIDIISTNVLRGKPLPTVRIICEAENKTKIDKLFPKIKALGDIKEISSKLI